MEIAWQDGPFSVLALCLPASNSSWHADSPNFHIFQQNEKISHWLADSVTWIAKFNFKSAAGKGVDRRK